MNRLFAGTEFDSIIGNTIKETILDNEDIYSGLTLEEAILLKEQLLNKINDNLMWYYLTCDAIKRKEGNYDNSNTDNFISNNIRNM